MRDIAVMSNLPRPLLLLWLLGFASTAALLAYWLFRRIREGRYILRPQVSDATFTETWTSGRSLVSSSSRWGGAGNCLWIAATPNQLLIGPHFPFNIGPISDVYRLEHQIAAVNLISVEQRKPMLGRMRAVITFRAPGAEAEEKFELKLRNLPGFLAAIQTMKSGSPNEMKLPRSASKYRTGQVWTYKTRRGEEDSRLTIVKIEPYGNGTAVHVHISGLAIYNSAAPNGMTSVISHMPFAEEAIDKSVVRLVEQVDHLPEFQDGYDMWKKEADAGKAGVFILTVAEAIEGIAP